MQTLDASPRPTAPARARLSRHSERTARGGAVAASFALGVVALLAPAAARAWNGLQMTPDDKRVLISRDVGSERWAIVQDVGDGSLMGNIYFTDGSAPAFVWCALTSVVENPDPALAEYDYDCFGTSTCTPPDSCPEWVFLSSVTLAGTFFEPPPPPTPTPVPTATPTATPGATASPTPTRTPTPTPKPTATPTPVRTATPTPKPPTPTRVPTPTPTPKVPPLVVTPDKATVEVGDRFLFVVSGGAPPYTVRVTIGGAVLPEVVTAAGSPFEFVAEAVGTSTIIVVDSLVNIETVPVTIK